MHRLFLLGAFWVGLFVSLVSFLLSCNTSPQIEKCTANPQTISGNGTTTLSVSLDTTQKYPPPEIAWQQLKPEKPLGKFTIANPTDHTTFFRGPIVSKDMKYTLQVRIMDSKGKSDACKVAVKVKKEQAKTWGDVGKLFQEALPAKENRQEKKNPILPLGK